MKAQSVRVEVTNQSNWPDIDVGHWAQVISDTLVGEGVRAGSLDLLFVDLDEMAALNQEHMDKSGPTDVLSFPLDDPFESIDLTEPGAPEQDGADEDGEGPPPLHIGDIVVCPAVADEQAPGHCGDLTAELTLLIVHGVLHLLGHDHAEPEESARMIEREQLHMARCGFAHPGPVLL